MSVSHGIHTHTHILLISVDVFSGLVLRCAFIFKCMLCPYSQRKRGNIFPMCLVCDRVGFPSLKAKVVFSFLLAELLCSWFKTGLYMSFKAFILTCHSWKRTSAINNINNACWLSGMAHRDAKMSLMLSYSYAFSATTSQKLSCEKSSLSNIGELTGIV